MNLNKLKKKLNNIRKKKNGQKKEKLNNLKNVFNQLNHRTQMKEFNNKIRFQKIKLNSQWRQRYKKI